MRCQLQTLRCVVVRRCRQLNVVLCVVFPVQFFRPPGADGSRYVSSSRSPMIKAERSMGVPSCMNITLCPFCGFTKSPLQETRDR